MQVIVILLLLSEYRRGVRSSGPPVILWIGLVVYGSIKMWTILAKYSVVSLCYLMSISMCFSPFGASKSAYLAPVVKHSSTKV